MAKYRNKKQIGVLCKPGGVDLFKRFQSLVTETGTFADIEFVKIEQHFTCHGRTFAGLIAMPDAKDNPHYEELLNFALSYVREPQ